MRGVCTFPFEARLTEFDLIIVAVSHQKRLDFVRKPGLLLVMRGFSVAPLIELPLDRIAVFGDILQAALVGFQCAICVVASLLMLGKLPFGGFDLHL